VNNKTKNNQEKNVRWAKDYEIQGMVLDHALRKSDRGGTRTHDQSSEMNSYCVVFSQKCHTLAIALPNRAGIFQCTRLSR